MFFYSETLYILQKHTFALKNIVKSKKKNDYRTYDREFANNQENPLKAAYRQRYNHSTNSSVSIISRNHYQDNRPGKWSLKGTAHIIS